MLKKVILAVSLAVVAGSGFAAQGVNYCNDLTGTWTGTYATANGGQQPISIYLNYRSENGYVYGWTLPKNDANGYKFGISQNTQNPQTAKFLMWAQCSYSNGVTTLSNLGLVSNANKSISRAAQCGQVYNNPQIVHLAKPNPLVLNLPYNGTTVEATFTHPATQAANFNQSYISMIRNLKNNFNGQSMSVCQPS